MPAQAAEPRPEEQAWSAGAGTTSLKLNRSLLKSLGIEVRQEQGTARPEQRAQLGFAMTGPERMRFTTERGLYRRLLDGELRHSGGLVLAWNGGSASLLGFVLRPAQPP